MRKRRKVNKQLNIWPGGYKKQKYFKGNPLSNVDKVWRIETFKEIRKSGGTYKNVSLAWGLSPNTSDTILWKVEDYCDELGIDKPSLHYLQMKLK